MVAQGTTLAGRYRLDVRLGAGGMGEVWRGEDVVLGRTVAVKVLLPGRTDDPGFGERFRGEARAMATINHPGVVDVYDYGVDQVPGVGAQAYLVMKFVDGEPLDRLLTRLGQIPPEAAMELIAQAASALQAVHEQGIVHRDIKPGNLLVRADGTLVLTDFGIARADTASRLTDAGMVLGTAAYCAPEQAEGAPVTPAVDIYALGVVAYECLAGHRPFDGDTPVTIALKHIREAPPPLPPHIPAPVRRIVEVALAKDPARRWPDAAAMSLAAKSAVAAEPHPAPAPQPPPQPQPQPQPGGAYPGGYTAGAHGPPPATGGHPGQPSGGSLTGGFDARAYAPTDFYAAETGGYQADPYQTGARQTGAHETGAYQNEPYQGGADRRSATTSSRPVADTGPATAAGGGRGRRKPPGRRRAGAVSALVAAGVLCVGGVAVAFTEFGGSEPTGNTSIARKNDNVPNVETAEPLDSPKPPKRTNDKPTTRPAEDEPRQTRTERPSETPEAKPSPSPTPTTPTKKPTPTPTPSVTRKVVPDVLGLTLAQAVDRLAAAGFKSKILVSGGEPAQDCFKVVQQDPAGGMRSDIRRPVELVVDPAAGCETPEPTVTPTATGSKPAAA